jgi:hypothetical protein
MLSLIRTPDYESIIKATIKHSDAVIVPQILSLKFNKIYRIFRKTFFSSAQDDSLGIQLLSEKVLSN